ncbi:MAG: DNA damage-inducible protein D, partial [Elusimicrobia bacterium]|nr:DNA damage-inducible protein D [Elusimicrobiota bacterium]
MNKELETKHVNPFEKIKQVKDDNIEFWYARDLAIILEYKDWRNFLNVINKAKEACKNSNQDVSNHFGDITKMVELGSGSKREIDDIALSRYACYLIIQNADPSKEIIAKGQTYFAIQTRKQELQEFNVKTEEEKRLLLRQEMKTHNKQLADAAKDAGVIQPLDYAIFQDSGYKGLYGGLTQKDIHVKKGLKKSQKILDHMGSTELAANLFRATQTEEKLRKEKINNKYQANRTHFEVGKKVR